MENKTLMIKYLQDDNKLIIYDNETLIGSFTIQDIIKYITSNISKIFLKQVDYESTKDVIKKYLCEINEMNVITLKNHLESPIMGNLEIIMKIYNDINKFDIERMQKEIELIDCENSKKIIKVINNLKYLILNHALKLIVNISNAIKNDETKNQLKKSLIKYSIFISNKINHLIYDEINEVIKNNNNLELQLDKMMKIKEINENKIKNFESVVEHQNVLIKKILDYIDMENKDDIYDMPLNDDLLDNSIENMDKDVKDINENVSNLNINVKETEDDGNSFTEDGKKISSINYLTPRN